MHEKREMNWYDLNCAVYIIGNVAGDDTNTYIYYTFIIIHYTVHIISVLSSHASLHSTLSVISLPSLSAAFSQSP